jgi:hypothetical protein
MENKMSDSNSSAKTGGISFTGALALVFIVMKLMGWGAVATWSWWWVLSPLWLPIVIVLGFMAIVFLFVALAAGISVIFGR